MIVHQIQALVIVHQVVRKVDQDQEIKKNENNICKSINIINKCNFI